MSLDRDSQDHDKTTDDIRIICAIHRTKILSNFQKITFLISCARILVERVVKIKIDFSDTLFWLLRDYEKMKNHRVDTSRILWHWKFYDTSHKIEELSVSGTQFHDSKTTNLMDMYESIQRDKWFSYARCWML